MNLYRIKKPKLTRLLKPREDHWLDGKHKWRLPAVKCSECSRIFSNNHVAYPQIDLPSGLNQKNYKKAWPLSWEEYENLKNPIQSFLPQELPLLPGTNFGLFEGVAGGPYSDFEWIFNWFCFVRKGALNHLAKELKKNLNVAPTKITSQRKEQPDYLELIAFPLAELTDQSKSEHRLGACRRCPPRYDAKEGDIRIKRSTIPSKEHIFRIRELPWFVLCTEDFRLAIEKLNLQQIAFYQVLVGEE